MILVLGDDPTVRRVICRLLRKEGYAVIEAAKPSEAWALGSGRKLGLLVSDVPLPEETGPNLANRFHAVFPELPVLFISGYREDAGPSREQASGSIDFLAKPFPPEVFLERVRACLKPNPHRRRWLASARPAIDHGVSGHACLG